MPIFPIPHGGAGGPLDQTQNPPVVAVRSDDATLAAVQGTNTIAKGVQPGAGVQGSGGSFGVIGAVLTAFTGETVPAAGAGVWGRGGEIGDGVIGTSVNHAGVVGDSVNFDGVFGRARRPERAGVSGHNPGGLAGLFEGNVLVTETLTAIRDIVLSNADCAEEFDLEEGADGEPGSVMVLGPGGVVRPSTDAYDRHVIGVVSGAGTYRPALILDRQAARQGRRLPLGLIGKVFCKVDARQGPIRPGDLLTTSSTPGHAMRADDPLRAFGATVGKALASLNYGFGLIPVMVSLR